MTVTIIYKDSCMPKIEDVDDVYTKGEMLCIRKGDSVTKYPLMNIHSITHAYAYEPAVPCSDNA